MDYITVLQDFFCKVNHGISTRQIRTIIEFQKKAIEFNTHTNILGTKEPDTVFIRHVLDCLSILELKEYFNSETLAKKIILDLGSGGGFPGILLAIIFQDSRFLLVDKSRKKSRFLNKTISELKLSNIVIINAEAELLARNPAYRESADYCIARAFANINILLELIMPFAKINGNLFFYKSRKVYQEITLTDTIIRQLGARVILVKEIKVPFLNEFRAIEVLEKVSETPKKYPRNLSAIKKLIIE